MAPVVSPPSAPVLYAFSYTVPGAPPRPTFVVVGAGEMRARGVGVQGIVRHGATSPEAMREKAAHVIEPFLIDTVLRPAAGAAMNGVRGFPGRPPIAGLEYEMDLRGVARELSL